MKSAIAEARRSAAQMNTRLAVIFDGKKYWITQADNLAEGCHFTQIYAWGAKSYFVTKIVG